VNGRPFTFRLERVRALRERTEERRREELAASLSHLVRGEAMLRAARERVDEAAHRQRELLGSRGLGGGDLIGLQTNRERLERAQRAAEVDRDRFQAEVGARRGALREAAADREVLERLKDRRRAAHQLEARRREAGARDEIALTRHRRREARA
jgi:flagellar FliJ protein